MASPTAFGRGRCLHPGEREPHHLGVEAVRCLNVARGDRHVMEGHAPRVARYPAGVVGEQEHQDDTLTEGSVDPDPFRQFARWYADAEAAAGRDGVAAHAMCLSTVGSDGRPSARMVLLRGFDERGFVFYTNYESRKANELAANPNAAVVFHWPELARQVRAEGRVERVAREETIEYFAARPRGHQLGTWASPQ